MREIRRGQFFRLGRQRQQFALHERRGEEGLNLVRRGSDLLRYERRSAEDKSTLISFSPELPCGFLEFDIIEAPDYGGIKVKN